MGYGHQLKTIGKINPIKQKKKKKKYILYLVFKKTSNTILHYESKSNP